jgi:hypothetical protein|tara:strand:+ start:242 stop:586 length:345 start_codon:yes stop_codon:yes gene_type:complete
MDERYPDELSRKEIEARWLASVKDADKWHKKYTDLKRAVGIVELEYKEFPSVELEYKVRVEKHYNKKHVYPECDIGKTFAAIAGDITITPRNRELLAKIGIVAVNVTPDPLDNT